MTVRIGVCSLSGLLIGDEPVRVVLLSAREFPDGAGVDGAWTARGPALSATYDPSTHAPAGWRDDICLRLARDQFAADGCQGSYRRVAVDDVLSGLAALERFKTKAIHYAMHPETNDRMRDPVVPAWLPTPRRVQKALAAAGVEADVVPAARGLVFVWPIRPEDHRNLGPWRTRVTFACYGASYVAWEAADETGYVGGMLVIPETCEVGADDVREALRTGGWTEDAEGGFEVIEWAEAGYAVRYLPHGAVGGQPALVDDRARRHARCRAAFVRRLRRCGIECGEVADRSAVAVPPGKRSLDSLARLSGMIASEEARDPARRATRHPRAVDLGWAIVRDDVWRRLLGTPGRRLDFEARRRAAGDLFAHLLVDAGRIVDLWGTLRTVYSTVEEALASGQDRFATLARADEPYRLAANWSLRHLAALRVRGEVTEEAAEEAVAAFAELAHVAHVEHVVADANVRWSPATVSLRSEPREDIGAAVRRAWAELAEADAERSRGPG